MRILEYTGLDTARVKDRYSKVVDAIAREDFRAAQVKKLTNLGHGKFYRARLDDADRLLFTLIRHRDEVCALMLEVIVNHAYDRSPFLRGADIDEAKIADVDAQEAAQEARPVHYLHPVRSTVHVLDRPLSFDDAQHEIYCQPPPLVIVGSAGSGKTALTLEKMKHAQGEVLYVTHSAHLAQSARNLYYGHHFETSQQEVTFLSYREFIESIQVPPGREATWWDFAQWFARMREAFREFDAHEVFEELRGVITAAAHGVLSREDYRALGVRQSIYPDAQRERLYDLFDRYRTWLTQSHLYELNLVSHAWRSRATPRYDFVVVDEVQDMTMAQLSLVLRTLRKPDHFLLCGDSNQVVHPNFFSWARVRNLFWQDPQLAERQQLRVLTANFRNGLEATRLANQLLKIKQLRFGSIDRESNYLVRAIGAQAGQVVLMADKTAVRCALDQKIRQSARFAVLVMRDEDKAEARKHFSTPLLFSVHEAKGLEYENIVLYRFVSDYRTEFGEIVSGVSQEALRADTLKYRRPKDKQDRSAEVYKFFVNALYVAITRATHNLYVIEADVSHPIFTLLGMTAAEAKIEVKTSTREQWQQEARKLDLQGKQEQADAIRRTILKETPVPWLVFDEARVNELLMKVFREQVPGSKPRQQLYDYATCYDEPQLARWLHEKARFAQAKEFDKYRHVQARKSYVAYFAANFREILKQCDQHGIDHRLPMNQTPLMAAAAAGNVALVQVLLERGADREAIDHYGQNALHWAMRQAFRDMKFAQGPFAMLYELLAPASIDLQTGGRLVRLDLRQSEYFLFQTLWVLFRSRFTYPQRQPYAAFDTRAILEAWKHLPVNVVRSERKRREYLSSILSRNEVTRDYAYNRALFMRVTQGWYQFNPKLAVRRRQADNDCWVPVFQALNLPLINEFACMDAGLDVSMVIGLYLEWGGLLARTRPAAYGAHQANPAQSGAHDPTVADG